MPRSKSDRLLLALGTAAGRHLLADRLAPGDASLHHLEALEIRHRLLRRLWKVVAMEALEMIKEKNIYKVVDKRAGELSGKRNTSSK